ncbi:site-2 protease family protein [bacterium]|nr:site-2 protease family protein [bacterium]
MAIIQWIIHNIPSVIAVCVAFGFIIAIHELGHFMMARRVGIRCPRFALGFGPRLFSFYYHGTEFSVCLFPLGGYVMMLGEDPENDDEESEFKKVESYVDEGMLPGTPQEIVQKLEEKYSGENSISAEDEKNFRSVLEHIRYLPVRQYTSIRELEGNFNDKSTWARMAVIMGGVTMNFISALILFWIIGASYGLVNLSPNSLPIVMKVFDNTPAAVSGLKYGDKIETIDNEPIVSGTEMIQIIGRHPNEKITLGIARGSEKLDIGITPSFMMAGISFGEDESGLPKVTNLNAFGSSEAVAETFKKDDIITAVNGQEVSNLKNFQEVLQNIVNGEKAKTGKIEKLKINFSTKDGRTVTLEHFADSFVPQGKIGIMPAQVTEFSFNNTTTNEIQNVTAGSIAEKEGLRSGDVIFFVNGARIFNEGSLQDILTKLQTSKEHLLFEVARGEEAVSIDIADKPASVAELGISFEPVTFGLTFKHSFVLIGRLIISPIIIVEQIVNKVLSPEIVKSSMSGPLGIMQMIFELSNDGLGKFLYIVALIDAAVGAFNVIPFPALDGARFLVLLIGAVRGKEIDPRKEAWIHQIGLYLLLALMIFVTFIDIQRIWAGVPLTH